MSFGAFLPEASDSQSFVFCLIFVKFPSVLMHHIPLLYITPCTLVYNRMVEVGLVFSD